jgi:arylsulfatase A-like enzyme
VTGTRARAGVRCPLPKRFRFGQAIARSPKVRSYLLGPLVISWPNRIKDKGGIRTQFHHVIDIVSTIYEAVGIIGPNMLNGAPQRPIEGVSMVYTFDGATTTSTRQSQYFEMLGNRAMYDSGWMASTTLSGCRGSLRLYLGQTIL